MFCQGVILLLGEPGFVVGAQGSADHGAPRAEL